MVMPIRIVICDDHPIVRRGIRALFETHEDYEVVAEAGNGREALEAVRQFHPALVLMEPAMPVLNGVDATSRIVAEYSNVRVLAFSMCSDDQYVSRMLAAGASGYLLKTCDVEELFYAVSTVLRGGTYLTPEVATSVVDDYINGRGPEGTRASALSDREREILQLLSEGYSAKEIGRMLHVSSRTVDSHRQRIMAKLRVRSVAGLTKCSIRLGLTTMEV
jgi:DNA-binding NarL/FixJ family response regulator